MTAPQMAQEPYDGRLPQPEVDHDNVVPARGKFIDCLARIVGGVGVPAKHFDAAGKDHALDRIFVDHQYTKSERLRAVQMNHVTSSRCTKKLSDQNAGH